MKEKMNTTSEQTKDILLQIKEKQRIIGFWQSKKYVAQNHIAQNNAKIKILEYNLQQSLRK